MKAVRPIRVEGSVAYVQLTKGFTAVVDAADVPLVAGFNWSATLTPNSVYALRTCQANGRRETVMLHRVILGAPKGVDVDHANGDGLDNRRCNLRLAGLATVGEGHVQIIAPPTLVLVKGKGYRSGHPDTPATDDGEGCDDLLTRGEDDADADTPEAALERAVAGA